LKIPLKVTPEQYEEAGSKFIVIPSDGVPKAGDSIALPIEIVDVADDTPGVSVKFVVKVEGEGENAGKSDKLSAGIQANAIFKVKDTVKALGIPGAVQIDPKTKKVSLETDELIGKKGTGIWVRTLTNQNNLIAKLDSIVAPKTGTASELGV
jgi:hypothetical protein